MSAFYRLKVLEANVEAVDVKSFVLQIPCQHWSVFANQPGQYVTFQLPLPEGPLTRCYSIAASDPERGRIEVAVRRLAGGIGSNWLMDHLTPGMSIDVAAPAGRFTLNSGGRSVVLVAGGIGITPIIAQLEHILANTDRSARLLYCNATVDFCIFRERLLSLQERYPDRLVIDLHFDDEHGRPALETLVTFIDRSKLPDLYICGPAGLMALAEEAAQHSGVDAQHVHMERFAVLPATKPSAEGPLRRVILSSDGGYKRGIECSAESSILQAAQSAGLDLPAQCKSGYCGTCRARLVKGEVSHRQNLALSDVELAAGWVLTCQAHPKTEIVELEYPPGAVAALDKEDGRNPLLKQINKLLLSAPGIASMAATAGLLICMLIFFSPVHSHLLNPGAMMPGHGNIACTSCHQPAPGSIRQQLQATIAFRLGQRANDAHLGLSPPTDRDCLSCHARGKDRHPIARFREPRFAVALAQVNARSCLGCHTEHTGQRVSKGSKFCAACHGDIALRVDPLDISHAQLAKGGLWNTCLGCHDFHGNHRHTTQTRISDRFPLTEIVDYLRAGPAPYGSAKPYQAREQRP